ncbi:hypothetical protein B0H17DRAFT_1135550 [Mycena rosella]|uniref:Uncharacterized protein n=1 Tax=Mycena rosella TaxID=1033263 RepID=A0AAD7GH10_MYCRO|nr:hypothetical protein B0H17DRAFT_1135550 [Mycena rosella]
MLAQAAPRTAAARRRTVDVRRGGRSGKEGVLARSISSLAFSPTHAISAGRRRSGAQALGGARSSTRIDGARSARAGGGAAGTKRLSEEGPVRYEETRYDRSGWPGNRGDHASAVDKERV